MGTKSNPADDDSRGLDAKDLNKGSRWINGPTFLWKLCQDWREINQTKSPVVSPDDKELKRISTFISITKEQCELTERLVYFSNWFRASKALALYLKYRQKLLHRVHIRKASKAKREDQSFSESITVADVKNAEKKKIVKAVLERAFPQ